MNLEKPMFDIAKGGRIVYNEYPYGVNLKTLEQLISYAMKLGLYYGVNVESTTCNDCGTQGSFTETCTNCGSGNITNVNRVCGYLSFSKIKGKNRYNEGKKAEIKDRVIHMKGIDRGENGIEKSE